MAVKYDRQLDSAIGGGHSPPYDSVSPMIEIIAAPLEIQNVSQHPGLIMIGVDARPFISPGGVWSVTFDIFSDGNGIAGSGLVMLGGNKLMTLFKFTGCDILAFKEAPEILSEAFLDI